MVQSIDIGGGRTVRIGQQGKGNRADVTVLVKNTSSIVGVVEVKLPEFDLSSNFQIFDYMVDLRNSFHVRYVYAIMTTYEKWKVFWFEDTNIAAEMVSIQEYDDLCSAGSANEYGITENAVVYHSPEYHHTDPKLIEVLVSFLYKASKSPIYLPNRFIDFRSRYIFATPNQIVYRALPSDFKFNYSLPHPNTRKFFVFSYFHRGGDGRVALCSSESGGLAVIKFLHGSGNLRPQLEKESEFWMNLWAVKCRIVALNGQDGLLMPFGMPFKPRLGTDAGSFCSLHFWNKKVSRMSLELDETGANEEFNGKINMAMLNDYQNNPILAAKKALSVLQEKLIKHEDLEWRHLALLPQWNNETGLYDLKPIFIDLTRVSIFTSEEEASKFYKISINRLEQELLSQS